MSEFTNKVPEAANITEIDDNISEKIHRNIKISQDNTREELLQMLRNESLKKSTVEVVVKINSVLSELENEKRLCAESMNIVAFVENMAVKMATHIGEVEKTLHSTNADHDEIWTKFDNIKLEIINMKKSYEQFVRTPEARLSEYSRGLEARALEKYQGHMDKMTNFICVRDIHLQQADEIISDHQILLQELRAQIQEKACEMEKVEHDRNMLQQLCDLAEKELQMIRTLEDYKQRLNNNVTASENKNTERNTFMLAVEGEIQAARDKIAQMQDETNALQMNSLSLSDEQLINYRFENIEIENNTAERNSNVERLVDELQIKEKAIPKLEMTLKKRKLQAAAAAAAAEDSIKKTRQEIVNLSGKIEKSKNEKAERERQINELQIKINNIERALSAANKEVHVEPGDVIEQPEHPRTPTDTTHILQTNQH